MENKKRVISGFDSKISNPDKRLSILVEEAEPNILDNIVLNFNSKSLMQGFIMAEIFGKPKAKLVRGSNIWNSRF